MVPPPLFTFVVAAVLFIVVLLTVDLVDRVGGAPAGQGQARDRGQGGNRKTQVQRQRNSRSLTGCLPSQCFIEQYAECFHRTSFECVNLLHGEFTATVTPPPSPPPVPVTQTKPPTPGPSPRPVTQTPTKAQRTQIFEIPILVRLLNVAEDYILSARDLERYLRIIRGVLDEALDDPWEIIRVEYLGEYVGERRLQSSLRGGDSFRRLSKTLYLPVLVTLRGEEDLSGTARTLTFILQLMRNKLSVLLSRIKSLNPNAFRNLQLSVEELNVVDVASSNANASGPIEGIQSTNIAPSTSTETNDYSTSFSSSEGSPFWVWLIVTSICICMSFILFMCMCRKFSVKSRDRVTKDEYPTPNQLAMLHGYGNSYGDKHEQKAKYETKRQNVANHRRVRSEGARTRRHGSSSSSSSSRKRSDERKRHDTKTKRQSSRKIRRRSDEDAYISNEDVDMDVFCGHRSSIQKEHERALVALPPRRASFGAATATTAMTLPSRRASFSDALTTIHKHDALVVYDDEKIRSSLEPEGSKIEDKRSRGAPREISRRDFTATTRAW
eukprot:scaffold8526_cov144-Skeletonema_menzelii.AAC.14